MDDVTQRRQVITLITHIMLHLHSRLAYSPSEKYLRNPETLHIATTVGNLLLHILSKLQSSLKRGYIEFGVV